MPLDFGIDVGTSSVAVVAWDADTGRAAGVLSVPNDAALQVPPGRAEQESRLIRLRVQEAVQGLAGRLSRPVRAVACTGQMHGLLLVDERLEPLSSLVTWQDRRAEALVADLRLRIEEAGGGRERQGCLLHPGYGAATLAWYLREGGLPAGTRWALSIADWIAASFSGTPATDPSHAASWGLYSLEQGDWDRQAVRALGIPEEILPPVREPGSLLGFGNLGRLGSRLAVVCGLGDNQASVLAATATLAPEDCCVVNVGTGSQVSVVAGAADTAQASPGATIEIRPFLEGMRLHVGASLNGGAAYALLRRFLAEVRAAPDEPSADALYGIMDAWAAEAPPGCDGLVCEPMFYGERGRGELAGSLRGITALNLSPGHLCRAVLEGMARTLADLYRAVGLPKRVLVGSGNAVRNSALFRDILCSAFGLPLELSGHAEEAAVGAAMIAARLRA